MTDVCTTIADYGGRGFKRALISRLLESEDARFLDEVILDQGGSRPLTKTPSSARRHPPASSASETTYNSAEDSLADGTEDDAYQYEYFDFDNK